MEGLLQLSNNSKTKFYKSHKNTFGLNYGLPENGGTCPGATSGTGGCLSLKKENGKVATCYMAKITKIYPSVGKVLENNTVILKDKTEDELVEILNNTVNEFSIKNKDEKQRFFRLHYSGDFFSETYVKAWAKVIKQWSDIRFWVYTRSFEWISYLLDLPNLTIFLSVDAVNYNKGKEVFEKYSEAKNLGMAWLGSQAPADYRWVVCPETSGRISNTPDQGACSRCRLCVDNYVTKVKNISFKIH